MLGACAAEESETGTPEAEFIDEVEQAYGETTCRTVTENAVSYGWERAFCERSSIWSVVNTYDNVGCANAYITDHRSLSTSGDYTVSYGMRDAPASPTSANCSWNVAKATVYAYSASGYVELEGTATGNWVGTGCQRPGGSITVPHLVSGSPVTGIRVIQQAYFQRQDIWPAAKSYKVVQGGVYGNGSQAASTKLI